MSVDSSSSNSFDQPSDDDEPSDNGELLTGLEGLIKTVMGYISFVSSPRGHVTAILRSLEALQGFTNLKESDKIMKFFQKLLSFGQELKVFFRVPNQQLISSRIQVIAPFVNFLLLMVEAILCFPADSIASIKGSIQNLRTELGFLITFLGDTPMHLRPTKSIRTDIEAIVNEVAGFLYFFFLTIVIFVLIKDEKINKGLKNIEAIVNEVRSFLQSDPFAFLCTKVKGKKSWRYKKENLDEKKKSIIALVEQVRSFLHFFAFSGNDKDLQSGILDLSLSDLLPKFDLLKTKIKEHCIAVSEMPTDTTPKRDVVSLFIVDSVLDDLMDLMSNKSERIAVVYDQILTLHTELVLLGFSVTDMAAQAEAEHEELIIRTIDIAYEVEYVIKSLPPVWYLTQRLPQIIKKIQLIWKAFQENKNITGAEGIPVTTKNPGEEASLQSKEPLVLKDILVGFEKEESEILDQLVRGRRQLQIISIVGMPGIGKTTLATKLYNHHNVILHFDDHGWCVVSQTYDKRNMLIDTLTSICHLRRDTLLHMDDESLAEKLYKRLKGRRYLIVIDDIWDINAWNDLRRYFPDDNVGSRILFTSRNVEVGLEASASFINSLPFLSNVECWELLKRKVFQEKNCPLELIDVGRQIAKSCYGLPLAVVVTAGVLADMEKKEQLWQKVARNLSSHISGNPDKILELSYMHLPMHLKPCFLYFAAFGEDEEIPVRKLISLWISEGFIKKEDNKSLLDVGMEYVMKLIDRSLVFVEKRRCDGGIKTCKIHDLLREMCSRLAQEKDFMKVFDLRDDDKRQQVFSQLPMYQQHQRLSINYYRFDVHFLPFGLHLRYLACINLSSPIFMSSSFKVLRIMHFYQKVSDPEVIGIEHLLHLRYLSISILRSSKQLPLVESFHKLEFLEVDNIEYKVEIPDILLKMVTLRQVNFEGGAYFNESCRQQATEDVGAPINVNLESISGLIISDERDEKILRCFPNLRRLKCVVQPSLWFSFDHFNQLESLKLSLDDDNDDEREVEEEKDSRPSLISSSFPSSLKKLTLVNVSLSQKQMKIIGGLLYLEVLKLEEVTFEGGQWKISEEEFPKLKFLKLKSVKLEEWATSSDDFPSLQRLMLQCCNDLKMISTSLGDIPTLDMIEVYACSQDVKDSAKEIQEEQEENGNEVLKVVIIPQ